MKELIIYLIALFVLSTGCYNSDDSTIEVYKYSGSVQCSGGGTPPETMQNELINAGIDVISYSCGNDGNNYAAVCGGPNGMINIFEIPENKNGNAISLGFLNLVTLSSAVKMLCN